MDSDVNDYQAFLAGKERAPIIAGIEPGEVNPILFPFQRDIVRWAVKLGRCALFADTGLGKTFIQIEWARLICAQTGGRVLILAPLAVTGQTAREAARLGVTARYCRKQEDVKDGITLANYEMLPHFDAAAFVGVVLDESSILKSFMGKTKQALITAFAKTPFRLACTATPAPNDHIELGNHSEFLGVMESSEMLTRWFINDTMQAGNYRLKGHANDDFWRWVSSWSVCVAKPSDLSDEFSDEGYVLPGLDINEHTVKVPLGEPAPGFLFHEANLNATGMHKEMRRTTNERVARAAEVVLAEPAEAWLIWCNTNYEADALRKVLPDAEEVRGNEPFDEKERKLLAFASGEIRILITKPSIAGHGLNYQNCARMAFVGLSYSYEQFYQALRRSYRFGQKRKVEAHVICAATEVRIRDAVQRKQGEHRTMQRQMIDAMRGMRATEQAASAVGAGSVDIARGEGWELALGDCVEVTRGMAPNRVHLSVFSPPFSNLYTYSSSLRDMGNSADDGEFMQHFGYLIPELLRVTIPGRLCAVHSKDLPRYRSSTGASGLRDFTGEITRAFEECPAGADGGRWVYHSKVTSWKCPVTEMQRTKSHGLLYKQLRKDSTYSRQGCPDYLTLFRKWTPEGDAPEPVTHTPEDFPLDVWQRFASPVWMDIDQTDVLNVQQARNDKDEKHICPLQLGVIERCIRLWSNPGDLVLSPFAGIGSEGYVALKHKRRFVGIELKPEYWKVATNNLRSALAQLDMFA
jgi:superfamily II DNA or RNA helicase